MFCFFSVEWNCSTQSGKKIGSALRALGEKAMVFSDEYETEKTEVNVEALLASRSVVLGLPSSIRGTIAASKLVSEFNKLECETRDGMFYTVMLSTSPGASEIISGLFDGFWCNSNHAWTWWQVAPD